jgi:hypothetical protein
MPRLQARPRLERFDSGSLAGNMAQREMAQTMGDKFFGRQLRAALRIEAGVAGHTRGYARRSQELSGVIKRVLTERSTGL